MNKAAFLRGVVDELSKAGGARLKKYVKGMSAESKYRYGTGREGGELRRLGRKAGLQPHRESPERVRALKERLRKKHLKKGLDHDFR
jgi:hypothetical protein